MTEAVLYSSADALEAISARLDGVFDNPQLLLLGALGDTREDIKRIIAGATAAKTTDRGGPAFAIVLEGGLVQCVVTQNPNGVGTPYIIVDYDVDGADADEMITVPQEDGSIIDAVGRTDEIALARIDIAGIKPYAAAAGPAAAPANPLHVLLLRSYPNADLLPFDHSDHAAIATLVAADATGDTLFNFLWRQLAGLDPSDEAGARERIAGALNDIQTVQRAFEAA